MADKFYQYMKIIAKRNGLEWTAERARFGLNNNERSGAN